MFVKQNFLDFWTYWYWASARAVPVSARLLVSAIFSWKARIKLALTTHGAIATAKARTVNLQVLRYVDVVGIKVNLRQKETVKLQWFKEFVRLQLHGNLRIYLIHSVSSHLKVSKMPSSPFTWFLGSQDQPWSSSPGDCHQGSGGYSDLPGIRFSATHEMNTPRQFQSTCVKFWMLDSISCHGVYQLILCKTMWGWKETLLTFAIPPSRVIVCSCSVRESIGISIILGDSSLGPPFGALLPQEQQASSTKSFGEQRLSFSEVSVHKWRVVSIVCSFLIVFQIDGA